jgi:hypothetical protein
MHKIHLRRFRFIWNAYQYTEKPMPSAKRMLDILDNISHDIGNDVLEEYTLDVLAGRAEPITTKPVVRKCK